METNDAQRDHVPPGAHHITQQQIDAFRKIPHSFVERYANLRRDDPALARELLLRSEILTPRDTAKKRAFVEGALFMYALRRFADETTELNELFEHPEPPSGEYDGEVPPPSA